MAIHLCNLEKNNIQVITSIFDCMLSKVFSFKSDIGASLFSFSIFFFNITFFKDYTYAFVKEVQWV